MDIIFKNISSNKMNNSIHLTNYENMNLNMLREYIMESKGNDKETFF